MHVLIVRNIFSEGPGTIAEYLDDKKTHYSMIDLSIGDAVPDLDSFTHLLIMGGPMAVYEMDRYPYLGDEAGFIQRAIKADKHVLGVCLGAQMLAHVLGARVYAGGQKEIGWSEVALTAEGMADPLMAALAMDKQNAAQVFQWHGDTFDIPKGAVRLASSALFPNQAFRYSDRVYALQFHIEVTPAIVFDWLKNEKGVDLHSVNDASNRLYSPYRIKAMNFYRGFFKR